MSESCVLITGIGGFIGKNVAEYLTDNGIDVVGVYRKKEPTCIVKKVISCDLAEEEIDNYIGDESIKAIIHFAGQMKGDKVRDYLDNTIGSTRKLINYAEKKKIGTFIYISSISVYGETLSQVNEMSDRINLDDYGMAKYICERMLEDAIIEKRIVIRLPRTLGKGCDLSYPWLPKVTAQMLKNEDIYYMNPELLYNNMLYVDDLSKFLVLLLNEKMTGYEKFVLGAKGHMSIIDILYELKRNLSSQSRLIEKSAEGRNKCYSIDIAYAEKYGFRSRNIYEIIQEFVKDIMEEK